MLILEPTQAPSGVGWVAPLVTGVATIGASLLPALDQPSRAEQREAALEQARAAEEASARRGRWIVGGLALAAAAGVLAFARWGR